MPAPSLPADRRRIFRMSGGLAASADTGPTWAPIELQDYQQPPPGDWRTWVFKAARNTGKTLTGAAWCIEHLREEGRAARIGIMAPTRDDLIETCAEGPTGLITLFGNEFTRYVKNSTGAVAHHYRGGRVRMISSTRPGRWNGPQFSRRWIDEAPLCDPEAIRQGDFGVRLGEHPQELWTMTPRGESRWFKDRISWPGVVITRASIYQNRHASARAVAELEALYGGTTLGRAFLDGQDVDVPDGAVWPMLGEQRERYLRPMPEEGPDFPRFVRTGAGADWGTSRQHLAAAMGASVTKEGVIWVREAFGSPSGSAHLLIKALRGMKDSIGANFTAYDRSQGSLDDWITDRRTDSEGEPIGAAMQAIKGDRHVEWRIGLITSALERGRLFFDSRSPEVIEAFETFVMYHRDDDGEVVEEDDDYADALCYLIAELEHPAGIVGSAVGYGAGDVFSQEPKPLADDALKLWTPEQMGQGAVVQGDRTKRDVGVDSYGGRA